MHYQQQLSSSARDLAGCAGGGRREKGVEKPEERRQGGNGERSDRGREATLLPSRPTLLSSAKLRNLRVNISVGFYTGPAYTLYTTPV